MKKDGTAEQESNGVWTFDRGIEVAKLIGIAAAGLWAVWLFFRYQQQELEIGTALAQIQAQKTELETKLTELDVQQSGVAAFTVDGGIERQEENGAYALARYNVNLQNAGKTDVKVTWVVVDWYEGVLSQDGASSGGPPAFFVPNKPPIPFIGQDGRGSIQWRRIDRSVCRFAGDAGTKPEWLKNETPSRGGCGTEVLRPGTRSELSFALYFHSRERLFIGATYTAWYESAGVNADEVRYLAAYVNGMPMNGLASKP